MNLSNSLARFSSLWRLQYSIPKVTCGRTHLFKQPPKPATHLSLYIHTSSSSKYADKDADRYSNEGVFAASKRKFKWIFQEKGKVGLSAQVLYEACSDSIDFMMFFKKFKLEDTFLSWFLLTELHVWMCLVRAMREDEEGDFLRYNMVKAMWDDVSTKLSKLTHIAPGLKRQILNDLNAHFQAALYGYDEGLLGDDKILAAALWRNFFGFKCDNPEHLEVMVQYVRMQVSNLDQISKETFFLKGKLNWLPFKELELQL